MATAVKTTPSPTPAPKPAAKAPSPLAEGARAGFDPLRPVRIARGFVGGTVSSTLNGTSNWGRHGWYVGLGLGLLACVAVGFAGVGIGGIILAGAGGMVIGSLAGGALGMVTGGARGIGRSLRAEKYAEDLQTKQVAKAYTPTVDYRHAYRAHQQNARVQGNYITDRTLQQERETQRDDNTYWRDRVDHERFHQQGGRDF